MPRAAKAAAKQSVAGSSRRKGDEKVAEPPAHHDPGPPTSAPGDAQPPAGRRGMRKADAGAKAAPRRGVRKAASGKGEGGAKPDRFLEEQRSLLLAERATYLHQEETLRAEAEQLAQEMEPGDIQFDEESGEGGTMNVERERDLALSAQARAAVDDIDRALVKLDAGSYGICEQCGEPIARARLKALPYAALCVACKSGGLSRR